MKCQDCAFNCYTILDQFECGAGHSFDFCSKGHWEGQGPDDKSENKDDPWKDCKDFKRKE